MNALKGIDGFKEKLVQGIMEQDNIWSVIEFLGVYLGKEVAEHLKDLHLDKQSVFITPNS